ncbi:beta-ketoacyl synthase N-terminal-like domain-containing protein [Flavobacterium sp.]|uniref:beta-ketoacyl synthase N-terminal-like domain-containing protein n=1 Tax=Flavobacterium sp. TaxID=239 RepID=UPI0037BF7C04
MNSKIAITSFASVSPLGNNSVSVWEAYQSEQSLIKPNQIGTSTVFASSLSEENKQKVADLRLSDSKYKFLDDSVLFAILASRQAVEITGWDKEAVFGINIGSSRGATQLFEKHHAEFLSTGKAQTLASPTTTLGNISSWVAQDLQNNGPEISHSITCSTALHALLNGIAWLRSGMADKFLVGGSEAPLTPFTIAQMQAMKIYITAESADPYPCKTFNFDKTRNSMVLGEAAAVICLESGESDKAVAYVEGFGYATENLTHSISISAEATCFQKSMKMALGKMNPEEIDVIITHSPGTIQGDLSEMKAIEIVFANHLPLLTNNKWKIGHTFGASGMLSVEMALLMLEHNQFIQVPFLKPQPQRRALKKIMVNAVGFGGNAVSIVLSKNA